MEVFSSAHSILFQHCHIDEIESSAFSGVLVNNITFDSSSVDRIHTSAFPDRALLQVSDYLYINRVITLFKPYCIVFFHLVQEIQTCTRPEVFVISYVLF